MNSRDFAEILHWVQIWIPPPLRDVTQEQFVAYLSSGKTVAATSWGCCEAEVKPSVTDAQLSLPLALTYLRRAGCLQPII